VVGFFDLYKTGWISNLNTTFQMLHCGSLMDFTGPFLENTSGDVDPNKQRELEATAVTPAD